MRFALVLLAALVGPGAAAAATIDVAPAVFSPRLGTATVTVTLERPRRVGVVLASRKGKRIGWLLPRGVRPGVSLTWDGRLRGVLVPDGRYLVQAVGGGRVLARAPVRLDGTPPRLAELSVGNGGRPFAGDDRLLATVSPNGDRYRERATVRFRLTEPALVKLEVVRTRRTVVEVVERRSRWFRAGVRELVWEPERTTPARTYLLRLAATDRLKNRRLYGGDRYQARLPAAPVVRVQAVDAAFTRRSYAPGDRALLRVSTDAQGLALQLFRSGPEADPTYRNDELKGVPVAPPVHLGPPRSRDAPRSIRLRVGDWPSGVYFARLIARDGRRGYAPFVVRPRALGGHRVAVVVPTNTWQAYNFADADGDGWGDTWYASDRIRSVDLTRPHLTRGVPFRYRSYDLPFLRWLHGRGKEVDYLSDDDLARVPSGERLAALYDLVVFAGHEEYVTAHVYDVVERYRDLGGNLMFLSANNFFWRVDRRGQRLVRRQLWRNLGRPEARLVGVQYLANDSGTRQAPYVVTGADALPWVFAGTGLANGSTFGLYGIEIDATTADTPPGTSVLAAAPDIFGPGRTAQMTYYETPAGAKVFAAGVLDFGGTAWPIGERPEPAVPLLLDNLWARLSAP